MEREPRTPGFIGGWIFAGLLLGGLGGAIAHAGLMVAVGMPWCLAGMTGFFLLFHLSDIARLDPLGKAVRILSVLFMSAALGGILLFLLFGGMAGVPWLPDWPIFFGVGALIGLAVAINFLLWGESKDSALQRWIEEMRRRGYFW